MPLDLAPFVSGMIAMVFLVCAAFFARSWTKTRDDLFLAFALAFLLLAVSQALTTLMGNLYEERSWIFVVRLAAFLLLAGAILKKNMRS